LIRPKDQRVSRPKTLRRELLHPSSMREHMNEEHHPVSPVFAGLRARNDFEHVRLAAATAAAGENEGIGLSRREIEPAQKRSELGPLAGHHPVSKDRKQLRRDVGGSKLREARERNESGGLGIEGALGVAEHVEPPVRRGAGPLG
jgi:hypothetical protein